MPNTDSALRDWGRDRFYRLDRTTLLRLRRALDLPDSSGPNRELADDVAIHAVCFDSKTLTEVLAQIDRSEGENG